MALSPKGWPPLAVRATTCASSGHLPGRDERGARACIWCDAPLGGVPGPGPVWPHPTPEERAPQPTEAGAEELECLSRAYGLEVA